MIRNIRRSNKYTNKISKPGVDNVETELIDSKMEPSTTSALCNSPFATITSRPFNIWNLICNLLDEFETGTSDYSKCIPGRLNGCSCRSYASDTTFDHVFFSYSLIKSRSERHKIRGLSSLDKKHLPQTSIGYRERLGNIRKIDKFAQTSDKQTPM